MNILLISLSFPPRLDAESLQSFKLYKYLKSAPGVDLQLTTLLPTNNPVNLFFPKIRKNCKTILLESFENRYLNFVATRWFTGLSSKPDLHSPSIRGWKKIVDSISSRPDVIISRSYPISSAIIASKIARHLGIPWVMQLSDPWSLSPLNPKGYSQEWNTRKERELIEQADIVTFTSEVTMANYIKEYPSKRYSIRYYPNTYDPDDIVDNPWVKKSRLRLVHTGTLGGSRTPDTFCEGVELFMCRHPESSSDIEVIFAGHASRPVRAYLSKKMSYLNFLGPVSFAESLSILRSADALILIDNYIEQRSEHDCSTYEFFPSKLLDYMLAQRPVIGISDENSLASEAIKKHGLGVAIPHNSSGLVADAIEVIWKSWKNGEKEKFKKDSIPKEYSSEYHANRLICDISNII